MSKEMITKYSEQGYIKITDGIERKTLVYGEKTLVSEFKLKKGKTLPMHQHPEEQTGYLVSGKIILIIEEAKYSISPGDSWSIPSNISHGAEIIEDSTAVEVFSPVRKDYLPK